MKKLVSILMVCVILTMAFGTTAFAETVVGSGSATISGSGSFSVVASDAPKYIKVSITNASGVILGIINVQKPDLTYYNNFITFTGNGTFNKRVYNAQAGTYTFYVSSSGTCTVTVTMTK